MNNMLDMPETTPGSSTGSGQPTLGSSILKRRYSDHESTAGEESPLEGRDNKRKVRFSGSEIFEVPRDHSERYARTLASDSFMPMVEMVEEDELPLAMEISEYILDEEGEAMLAGATTGSVLDSTGYNPHDDLDPPSPSSPAHRSSAVRHGADSSVASAVANDQAAHQTVYNAQKARSAPKSVSMFTDLDSDSDEGLPSTTSLLSTPPVTAKDQFGTQQTATE